MDVGVKYYKTKIEKRRWQLKGTFDPTEKKRGLERRHLEMEVQGR